MFCLKSGGHATSQTGYFRVGCYVFLGLHELLPHLLNEAEPVLRKA